jgi:hypothetical protein
MKKSFYILILLLTAFSFYNGCSEDVTPSLYQTPDPKDPPVINSVEPPNSALAGVSVVTINGANFSDDESRNTVFFNSEPGTVLEATPTQLKVRVPNISSDSLAIRVGVIGNLDFSNKMQYSLTPAYAPVKKSADAELFSKDVVPHGITTDAQGNIFVSVVEFSLGTGIKKISPSGTIIPVGELVNFAPKGGETFFNKLNMWQNNIIIGARRQPAVFEITEGVAAKPFATQGLKAIYDIDFDQSLNIWAGGKDLFRITPDKNIKSFNYTNDIKSIRIFNDYLYILTTVDSSDLIRRFRINSADELGPVEDVFNITQTFPSENNIKILGTDFEFAADGDIILGTTKRVNPIVVVHPDGTSEPLYPGVVPDNTRVFAFDWDPGNYLYFTREASGTIIQSVIRLDMQKSGAPHYGR